MDFKILINKNAIPVLIEVPEKPSLHPSSWIKGASSLAEASRLYEQAVSTAIADESKHIQFRDELHVKLYCDDLLRKQKGESLLHVKAKIELPVGQTFDLPENVSVSFDWSTCENDICLCIYFEKSDCGYTRKLAILTPLGAKEYQPLNVSSEEYPEIIAFLMGVGHIDGYLFGDDHQYKRGKFWWRNNLFKWWREFADTQRRDARKEAIQECIDRVIRMAGIDYWQDEKGKDVLGKVCEKLESLKKKAP